MGDRLVLVAIDKDKMEKQEWVGIQFNLDRDMKLKSWLEKYKKQGIETDGEHIRIEFGKNELKRLKDGGSSKVYLIESVIRKCLEKSSYTNIYCYINVENIAQPNLELLRDEFKEPVRVVDSINKDSILSNFSKKTDFLPVYKTIKRSLLTIIMDKIFKLIVNRDFGLEQKLALEVSFEDKLEWDADSDELKVSIQLELEEQ